MAGLSCFDRCLPSAPFPVALYSSTLRSDTVLGTNSWVYYGYGFGTVFYHGTATWHGRVHHGTGYGMGGSTTGRTRGGRSLLDSELPEISLVTMIVAAGLLRLLVRPRSHVRFGLL